MSDARLRELERRWKETNSPDDEAAYLLERVRVGDLTRERLELAAYCGHQGSAVAIGATRGTVEFETVKERFERWPHRLQIIVLAAALETVEPVWRSFDPRQGPIQATLQALHAWTAVPRTISEEVLRTIAADAHALSIPLSADPGSSVRNVAFGASKAAIACVIPHHALRAFANLVFAAEVAWDAEPQDVVARHIAPTVLRPDARQSPSP